MLERDGCELIDVEAQENVWRADVADAEIFTVNAAAIMNYINKHTDEDFVVEKAAYDEVLAYSVLRARQCIGDERRYYWQYQGEIKYRGAHELSSEEYYRALGDLVARTSGITLSEFYFNNHRLMCADKSNAAALVAYYKQDRKVTYSNHSKSSGKSNPAIYAGVEAPSLAELKSNPYGQFGSHVRQYILALNAVALALGQQAPIGRFAVTLDGPLYGAKDGLFAKVPSYRPDTKQPTVTLQKGVAEAGKDAGGAKEATTPKVIMLEDIGGLEQIKEDLQRVVFSFKNAEAMERWGAERPQGIYLYGPAGTGKTTLARALANEIGGELWQIKSSQIYDKWLGNSEKNLQDIFDKAHRITKPTVMFWDEFDALIKSGADDGGASHAVERVAGIFKTEVERLRQNQNIIMVAATNKPGNVDEALVRDGRFDIKAYVPLPDDATRLQIFANTIAERTTTLAKDGFLPFSDDLDLPALVKVSEGMSGAAIVNVFKRAAFTKAMQEKPGAPASSITQQDLLGIITAMRQS